MWPNIKIDQFKLFVFDVDGTILELEQELNPFTVSVIHQLKNRGLFVTLATGKNLRATRKVAEKLEIDLPLVLANGCVLQTLDGEIHQQYILPKDFLPLLIEECERGNLDLAIQIEEEIYVKKININVSLLFDYGSPSLEEVGNWSSIESLFPKAYKCLVIDRKNQAKLFKLEERIRSLVGDSIGICQTLTEAVEFMPSGVTKMTGINAITSKYDIELNSVMAFGDGNNDAEMLAAVGFGVAVENASDFAKKHANWISPACAEQGPAKLLNYLMNN